MVAYLAWIANFRVKKWRETPYLAGMERKFEKTAIPCGKIAALVCVQNLLYLAGMTTKNYQKLQQKNKKKSSGQSIGLALEIPKKTEKIAQFRSIYSGYNFKKKVRKEVPVSP